MKPTKAEREAVERAVDASVAMTVIGPESIVDVMKMEVALRAAFPHRAAKERVVRAAVALAQDEWILVTSKNDKKRTAFFGAVTALLRARKGGR